jgi:serine/threonine-protein kinase RsbT
MAGACDNDELLAKILGKYMPERAARSVIDRARRATGTHLDSRTTDRSAFFVGIEQQAATLLDRRAQSRLRGELEFELATGTSGVLAVAPATEHPVEVRSDWDVSVARARARELMTALGAKSCDVVRVMTLVSELARNIVLYAACGKMVFTPSPAPRSLVVEASDEGPGIPNLNEVLSGHFRSKTGLGKGLIDVRRAATRFTIHTNSRGTRVEAEVEF